MNKFATAALCIALAVVMVPTVASAKNKDKWSNKTGRFGIGYDQTLGGVGGLSARFQVAKNFGLQGILSFGHVSADKKDTENQVQATVTNQRVRGALRGDVGVAFTKKAALSVIFGVNVLSDSNEDVPKTGESTTTDDTRFSFEAGLKAEYHFTNFFSVHGEVGMLFALVNRSDDASVIVGESNLVTPNLGENIGNGDIDGSVILFGAGETFGNFGFTFWFK